MERGGDAAGGRADAGEGGGAEFALEEKLLEKIGKELAGKCGNLALAICILGGVLRNKKSVKDWESVNENFKAVLYGAHDAMDRKIEEVVTLSYENLPYNLKPCFLSLGILREDEIIGVEELYGMWIAQGIIPNQGNDGSLMDTAELFLHELAMASIVQLVDDEIEYRPPPIGKFSTCKLHDIVRELCLKIGEKEDFGVAILEYNDGILRTITRGARQRHLAIHFRNKYEDRLPTETHPHEDVRSLRILNDAIDFQAIEFPPQSIVDFKKYKYLRELVIESFKFEGRKLPKGIIDLVLLRCLRLQSCKLDELPSSLRKLVYLETLDLRKSSISKVPDVLKKLLRLFLPPYFGEAREYCGPRLDEAVDELETLVGFNSSLHELTCTSSSKNLRQFHAEIRDHKHLIVILDAITNNWNKLKHCELEVTGNWQLTSEDELIQLFTCPKLSFLDIMVEFGKLPLSSAFISSKIVRLHFFFSKIEDDPMGILGMFPSLKELMLMPGAFVGEQMRCPASSFRSLKWLVLNGLPNLREWIVEQGAMPSLSKIYLHDCPNLKVLPDGLRCISTLKRVAVNNMPELAKRVSPGGEDFPKIHHVPLINIHED
ncbi:disease resistance protein RPH8A-like [Salvia miltiorrhiza]|uniref:disease resistance protein RPH8A-like n=1 Tax=Salvia miltiorrhiza TaxID=226208 RepID=UPI0025AD2CDF|nr:disease resistance protein RPH8A-like [Salvia miltiorrhiza]